VCLFCKMLLSTVPPFPVGQRPKLPHRYHGNTNERAPHRPKLTLSGGAFSDVPHEICLATRLEQWRLLKKFSGGGQFFIMIKATHSVSTLSRTIVSMWW